MPTTVKSWAVKGENYEIFVYVKTDFEKESA